jgi:cyclophilin family peptidyl-prolyl cis-trans isomerase
MAQHKAPTQVTIASIQQESAFNQFVERYWKLGVGLALVVSAAILIPTYQRAKSKRAHHSTWDDFGAQASLGSGLLSDVQGGPVETLALFADQNESSPVGGWAKALEVGVRVQALELDEAEKAAGQLESRWPAHFLARTAAFPGADGKRQTLSASLMAGKASLDAWEKEHAFLFSNPELPADAPRVRLNTSKGAIVVGLYSDRAPRHVENFLKLAREGYYTGTKFHRVVRGQMILGGDPNTVSGAPESWGLGGPESKLELELDPRLRHFKGALAAWRPEGAESSHGSQFFIDTGAQHALDGKAVVFGRVLEGEATLEVIESGAVVEDVPQDPAVIESVEVL